jgi:hypothetical protein
VVHTVSSLQDILQRSWSTPGTKVITVTVANAGGTASATHTLQVIQPVAWNLLFYMSGDKDTYKDEESDNGYNDHYLSTDDEDMINMLETVADNADVNILVLWDDFGDNNTRLYHLQHDTDTKTIASPPLTVAWNPGERNMGDPQTLQDFVQWARAEYPAQHTLLTVYDHGCGWAPHLSDTAQQATWMQGGSGLAWDETAGDYLANREIGSALQAIADSGGKLDVVFYDASLDAMLENAYEIRNSASYLVASQNVMHKSFPYQPIITTMTDSTIPSDLARQMVTIYKNELRGSKYMQGGTLSAIALAQIDPLMAQFETLVDALRAEPPDARGRFYDIYRKVQKFDLNGDLQIEDQRESAIDLQHFASLVANANLSKATTQAAAQLQSTLADSGVILAKGQNNRDKYKFSQANGLSIYLPFGAETFIGAGCAFYEDYDDEETKYCEMRKDKTCLCLRDYYTNTTPSPLAFVQATAWDEWLNEVIQTEYPCPPDTLHTTDAVTETESFPAARPVTIISSPLPGKMDLTIGDAGTGEEPFLGIYLPMIRR